MKTSSSLWAIYLTQNKSLDQSEKNLIQNFMKTIFENVLL